MVTMKDVAKKAGVSQATVSRVINGSASVNAEIKTKVMEWVRKLDYQPNIMAQSLVGNKSLLIGVIITDIANPFFSDIIKVIESEAAKYGYSIILCNTDCKFDKEKKYINILKSYNVDGILIVPSSGEDSLNKLKNIGIPAVVITQELEGCSCVSISHYLAGKYVAKHLISMGFSKFVFVGGDQDEKGRGFKDEIQKSGFDVEKSLIIINEKHNNSIRSNLKAYITDSLDNEGIGIFAYNDVQALIVLHALKEMKIKVPDRVALVGFDNTFISKEVSPTISSVAQPIDEIGKQSVEVLIDKIYEKEEAKERHIILEPRLVVRESSKLE
jgi:LacI family transcriptional regulator